MSAIKLIKKIKENEILYKNYKISQSLERSRNEKWREVADTCKIATISEAQTVWKTILNNYKNFLRHGGDFPYVDEMQFMQGYMFKHYDEDDYDEDELDDIINSEEEFEQCSDAIQEPEEYNNESVPINGNENNNGIEIEEDKQAQIQPNGTVITPPYNLAELTSLELIFLGYAKVLGKMPLNLQIQTKRKIAEIMDETEIKLLQEK